MKVIVHNLGVIEEAEIDLKPLTIFVGPNNAGKTWLTYTLSGILGPYGWSRYLRAYILDEVQQSYPPLEDAIQQILDVGNAKIDLVQFADEYGELYFNNVANLAQQWMQEFMGTDRIDFDDLKIQVSMGETKSHFLEQILNSSSERNLSFGQARQGALLTAFKEAGKRDLYIYTLKEGSVSEELPRRVVKEFLVGSIFQTLHQVLYLATYTFPTERTAYITFPFQGIGEETLIPREQSQQEQNPKAMSWPVGHFLNMILTLFRSSLSRRRKEARNNTPVRRYMELAHLLERNVLSGGLDFSTQEPDPRREILFKPTKSVTIDIPITSSMVKELSPLVLYLRYLATSGDWLIIDEPEMNLHPVAQVRLIEFLAMLVNAGLHVLMTTHSTYVIDHLTNLMDAHKHKNQDGIAEMFLLERKEAFISHEKVAVYGVENGQVKNILGPQGVIDWKTFSDVTKLVERIHFELLGECAIDAICDVRRGL